MRLSEEIRGLTQQLDTQTQLLAEERRSRHLLESALQKSEEKFDRAFRSNPAAMMITRDDRILNVNASFCQLLEYTPQEVSGKSTQELNLWAAGDRDRWCHSLDTVGAVNKEEFEFSSKAGQLEPVLVSAEKIDLGGAIAVLTTAQSLGTRKPLTQALLEKEQFLRSIYEGVGQSIFVIDVEAGVFRYSGFNPTCERLTGISSSEAQGKTPAQIHTPDSAATVTQHYQDCLASEISHTYEEFLPFQGQELWWLTTLTPLRDAHSQVYRIIGTSLNVTPQKHIEAALQRSQAKLNDVLNSAGAAIASFRLFANGDWEHEYCSAGTAIVFGYSQEDAIADKNIWISQVQADDREAIVTPLYQDFFAERTVTIEYRFHHRDGSLRWISGTYASRRDHSADCWVVTVVSHDITQSKQLELALQASQLKLSDVLRGAIVVLGSSRIYPNGDWTLDYVSPGSEAIYGYTAEELLADKHLFVSRVDPQDLETIFAAQLEPIKNQKTVSYEFRFRHKDDRRCWIAHTLSSQWDEAENCWVVTTVATDMTDRKQSEAALQKSEEQRRLALEFAHIGSWDWNLTTNVTIWNDIHFYLLGLTPGKIESSQQAWRDRVHPDDLRRIEQAKTQALTSHTDYSEEYRVVHPDGRVCWVLGKGRAIYAVDRPVRMVGVIMDITERKQAEFALQASEEQLQLVLNANNDGIWDWNILTQQIFRSRRWLEISGYAINEAIDASDWLNLLHPDDLENVVTARQAYFGRQTPQYVVEFRLRCKDGTYKWCESRATAQWGKDGQPIRMVGSLRDITERKRRSTELKQAKEAAEAANLAKGAFLANINHELRTPLAIILGCSELLRYDHSLNEKQKARLATIDRSVQHLLDLINNVLELSKIEVGAAKINLSEVNLPVLLQNLEEMFRVQADAKDIRLIVDRAPEMPELVQTDEGKLRQVVVNLLSNAVKFTEQGSVKLRIWGQNAAQSSSSLHFEVSDTGLGIAPAEIDTVFDAFVQTETGRKSKKGTGLGLAICRQFVQLLGGQITVCSGVGQGTRFAVEIPAQFAHSTSPPVSQSHSDCLSVSNADDRPLKCLLNEMPREWIAELQRSALQLNADRCLRLIEKIPPDFGDLAQRLSDLVANFQFDALVDLTKD